MDARKALQCKEKPDKSRISLTYRIFHRDRVLENMLFYILLLKPLIYKAF